MKAKDQLYYLRLVKKTLEEIQMTPPNQGARFLILKKRAAKYLNKAKEFPTK